MIAAVLFGTPLLVYLFLPLIAPMPEPIGHVLLTLTAVMAVHLLDRLWLFRDTQRSLKHLTDGIRDDIRKQTASLVHSSSSLEAMRRSGIVRVYSSRSAAVDDINRDLGDPHNTSIRLSGISLNDFVREGHDALRGAWKNIEACIRHEKGISDPSKGLDIKALIIDPQCFGAHLRSCGEARSQRAVAGRLRDDVLAAAETMMELESIVRGKQDRSGVRFECRLYRLPPIMFLCHLDTVCYVQQYHFWSSRESNTPIPVIRYRQMPEAVGAYSLHKEMNLHFDWIWENASVAVSEFLEQHIVGTDKGIGQSGTRNVFADQQEAYKRIRWLLGNAKEKVCIQGISLHSFFKTGELLREISNLAEGGSVEVNVLLLDPDCEQAKHRSYRESLFVDEGQSFAQYKQSVHHQKSDLYQDTMRTINNIKDMAAGIATRQGGKALEEFRVRLYDSATGCFMLRVDDTVLIEQYHYGKIVPAPYRGSAPVILGKDMPIFEYAASGSRLYDEEMDEAMKLRNPFGLLEDHFAFAFKQGKPLHVLGLARGGGAGGAAGPPATSSGGGAGSTATP